MQHFLKTTFFSLTVCATLIAANTNAFAAVPDTKVAKRPFPQHTAYAPGSIKPKFVIGAAKPTLLSPAQLDTATAKRYVAWRKAYLNAGCGAGRNYIYVAKGNTSVNTDVNRDTLTVSEGHGYGMLIFAWMAGYDVNAKKYFDGMVRYWQDHQASSGAGLMAWNQVRVGCKNAVKNPAGESVNGSGTATDGDLDIAYALLLADKQWGSTGTFNYRQLAISVIQAIRMREINPITHHVLLGDWVKPTEPEFYYATRPSDFMLSHFRAFLAATNHGEWTNVINKTYDIINAMQTRFSPATGLLPDFVVAIQSGARPAATDFLEGPDGWYAYNSCRTPWRIGMDYLLYGEPRARIAVGKINTWIKAKTTVKPSTTPDPGKILDGYKLNGVAFGTGDDLAFVAPFGVSAMASSVNQEWLDKIWAGITARTVSDTDYFGETITMLSMIAMSGNAWKP
jgi:endoglucanase